METDLLVPLCGPQVPSCLVPLSEAWASSPPTLVQLLALMCLGSREGWLSLDAFSVFPCELYSLFS